MKNKFRVCIVAALMLAGCNEKEKDIVNDVSTISEHHKITSIENGNVHGELVNGSGEGIFYSVNEFEQMGIDDVSIGDVIEIAWSEDDFNNEEWDNIYTLELVK